MEALRKFIGEIPYDDEFALDVSRDMTSRCQSS